MLFPRSLLPRSRDGVVMGTGVTDIATTSDPDHQHRKQEKERKGLTMMELEILVFKCGYATNEIITPKSSSWQ